MSSRQVAEWLAFNAIEPVGEVRGDLRAGIVASTIVNVNKKRGAKASTPKDFMPDFDKGYAEEEDKEENIFRAMMALAQQQDIKAKQKKKKKAEKIPKEVK